jgi:transcriptional regulator with XRE-family HTH domain
MITGRQIRQARALLQWSYRGLAARAGIDVKSARRAEYVDDEPSLSSEQAQAIQQAFEAAGVEFQTQEESGVRLSKPPV